MADSKYARKRKGEYKPELNNDRPSWFVRSGLAALAAEQARRNEIWERKNGPPRHDFAKHFST